MTLAELIADMTAVFHDKTNPLDEIEVRFYHEGEEVEYGGGSTNGTTLWLSFKEK